MCFLVGWKWRYHFLNNYLNCIHHLPYKYGPCTQFTDTWKYMQCYHSSKDTTTDIWLYLFEQDKFYTVWVFCIRGQVLEMILSDSDSKNSPIHQKLMCKPFWKTSGKLRLLPWQEVSALEFPSLAKKHTFVRGHFTSGNMDISLLWWFGIMFLVIGNKVFRVDLCIYALGVKIWQFAQHVWGQ